MDSIKPENIPIIDKEIVRENFYDIITKSISKKEIQKGIEKNKLLAKVRNYYLVHTSGSTGKPCNFLYDRNAIMTIESNFIRLSIGGKNIIALNDFPIRSLYIASVGSGYASTALALKGLKSYHAKSVIVNAATPLYEWKEKIQDYNPTYISGYTSCLNIVAHMQEHKHVNFNPKKIITGGEPVSEEAMSYYSNLFNADIINYYGCTESIVIGMGSSWYDGMYLFDDLNYVEVDELGRLIITPLHNRIFPLIRYRLNDIVEGFTKKSVGCLPFTHISRVVGRCEEIMWYTREDGSKDFLHPLFIDDLDVKGIEKYQFEQVDKNSFILRCVKMPYANEYIVNEIKRQVNGFLIKKKLQNVNYKIEFVDKLSIDPATGKTKLVVKSKAD